MIVDRLLFKLSIRNMHRAESHGVARAMVLLSAVSMAVIFFVAPTPSLIGQARLTLDAFGVDGVHRALVVLSLASLAAVTLGAWIGVSETFLADGPLHVLRQIRAPLTRAARPLFFATGMVPMTFALFLGWVAALYAGVLPGMPLAGAVVVGASFVTALASVVFLTVGIVAASPTRGRKPLLMIGAGISVFVVGGAALLFIYAGRLAALDALAGTRFDPAAVGAALVASPVGTLVWSVLFFTVGASLGFLLFKRRVVGYSVDPRESGRQEPRRTVSIVGLAGSRPLVAHMVHEIRALHRSLSRVAAVIATSIAASVFFVVSVSLIPPAELEPVVAGAFVALGIGLSIMFGAMAIPELAFPPRALEPLFRVSEQTWLRAVVARTMAVAVSLLTIVAPATILSLVLFPIPPPVLIATVLMEIAVFAMAGVAAMLILGERKTARPQLTIDGRIAIGVGGTVMTLAGVAMVVLWQVLPPARLGCIAVGLAVLLLMSATFKSVSREAFVRDA